MHEHRWIPCFLVAAALSVAAPRLYGQLGKVRPFDDAGRDLALVRFRARLLASVQARDTQAVLASVAPGVGLGFGGDSGVAQFARMLRDPGTWDELRDILTHGGRLVSDSTFCAPYWTGSDSLPGDAFELSVIIGSSVRVRERPDARASIMASLSYDIVRIDRNPRSGAAGWSPVLLRDGRHGFVAAQFVRSPIGMRLVLSRRVGRWWITAFYGGD
jgi:hypothetical protein